MVLGSLQGILRTMGCRSASENNMRSMLPGYFMGVGPQKRERREIDREGKKQKKKPLNPIQFLLGPIAMEHKNAIEIA